MDNQAWALAQQGLNLAMHYSNYNTPNRGTPMPTAPPTASNLRGSKRGRSFTSYSDLFEDEPFSFRNKSLVAGNQSRGGAAHHYYSTGGFKLHDVPNSLRLTMIWNTLFPRLVSRTGGFWLNGAGDCGDFAVVKDTISASALDTTSVGYYKSIPDACSVAVSSLTGVDLATTGGYQSGLFHVNTARQTVLWFGALNLDMADQAMSTIQSYSPIGNIIYNGQSAVTTTYQGGVQTKAVTIRGFTREISFTNMDSNDLYFTFYECAPKEDLAKGYGPLDLWSTGFSNSTQNVLLYPQSVITSAFAEGDGITPISNVTNKSIHTICHSGETPHRKGLISLHKKWYISTPKVIKVSNGECLKFTQNYKGGHVTYMDVYSPDGTMFYKQGLSKGTLVTVTGHMGVQVSSVNEQPTGVVTTGSGQFVCRSESKFYFEAVLPSLPDSIIQTDNLYKGEATAITGITTQYEMGVDNTTLEVEREGVHDG